MNAAILSGKMFCEGSLSQEEGLNRTYGALCDIKQQSRMRSSESLNSVESGVEKDTRSQCSSSLLEKMSQAIAKRKNSDPKADVNGIKVSTVMSLFFSTALQCLKLLQKRDKADLNSGRDYTPISRVFDFPIRLASQGKVQYYVVNPDQYLENVNKAFRFHVVVVCNNNKRNK